MTPAGVFFLFLHVLQLLTAYGRLNITLAA